MLPSGLWSDVIFDFLPVSDILAYRLVSHDSNDLVLNGLQRLIARRHSRKDLFQPTIHSVEQLLRPVCNTLKSLTSPKVYQSMHTTPMPPDNFCDTRLVLQSILSTYSTKDVQLLYPALVSLQFPCLERRELLDRALKRISAYRLKWNKVTAQQYFAELGPIYDFIIGFHHVVSSLSDDYFSAKYALVDLSRSLVVLEKLSAKTH